MAKYCFDDGRHSEAKMVKPELALDTAPYKKLGTGEYL
jgi:hypothetical protein